MKILQDVPSDIRGVVQSSDYLYTLTVTVASEQVM
jgi:hypothetical protein